MKLASYILSFLLIPFFIQAQNGDKIIFKLYNHSEIKMCDPDFSNSETLLTHYNYIPIGIASDKSVVYYYEHFTQSIMVYNIDQKTTTPLYKMSNKPNAFLYQEEQKRILFTSGNHIYSLDLTGLREEIVFSSNQNIETFDEHNGHFIITKINLNWVYFSNRNDSIPIDFNSIQTIVWDHTGNGFYGIESGFSSLFHYDLQTNSKITNIVKGLHQLFKTSKGLLFSKQHFLFYYDPASKQLTDTFKLLTNNLTSYVGHDDLDLVLSKESFGLNIYNFKDQTKTTVDYGWLSTSGKFAIHQTQSKLAILATHPETMTPVILEINWIEKTKNIIYQSNELNVQNDKIFIDYYSNILYGSNQKLGRIYKLDITTKTFEWILESGNNAPNILLGLDPLNRLLFFSNGTAFYKTNIDQLDQIETLLLKPVKNLTLDFYNKNFYHIQRDTLLIEYTYQGVETNHWKFSRYNGCCIHRNSAYYLRHHQMYGFDFGESGGGNELGSFYKFDLTNQKSVNCSNSGNNSICWVSHMDIFYHHIYTNTKDEHNRSMDMLVYPNPLQRELLIIPPAHSGEISRASIVSISGQSFNLEIENTQNESYRFSLPTLPAGVYILNVIMQDGKRINQKVIIAP